MKALTPNKNNKLIVIESGNRVKSTRLTRATSGSSTNPVDDEMLENELESIFSTGKQAMKSILNDQDGEDEDEDDDDDKVILEYNRIIFTVSFALKIRGRSKLLLGK